MTAIFFCTSSDENAVLARAFEEYRVIKQENCLMVGDRKSPTKSVLCKNDICVMEDADIMIVQDVVFAKERKD